MAYRPPDGIKRPAVEEHRLNEALALCFSGEAGAAALAYLRAVTIESVGGPGIRPDHLMHLEGQRFIVGLIEQRIRYGKDKQPEIPNG